MHLKKSARNKHLTVILVKPSKDTRVASFSLRHLLENRSIIFADDDPYYQLKECWVVGSCNGILCLLGESYTDEYVEYWLFFWNPATRTISEKLGYFSKGSSAYFRFSFGYDNSMDTYKVVALHYDCFIESQVMEVRVFSLGENVWRNIQSFPVFPFEENDGVYLSGTLNLLALSDGFNLDCWKDVVVIISLDLATETHRQLPLPPGFDEAPPVKPTLSVLMDSLCFSHDFKRTYFVIWQMTEFGVGESWTQFLKIGYQNLQYDMTILGKFSFRLTPLRVSENCDILIWRDDSKKQAILYNWRDNSVKGARINDAMSWFIPKDYVESLVSPF